MSTIEHRFNDKTALIEALYLEFVADIEAALGRQQPVTLLLSGGSTPAPLYQRLSTAELDWARIRIALVDERWVDADHAASNARLLAEKLLVNNAARAQFLGMKNSHASPFEGEAECDAAYATLPAPYSFCLLGMGADSHTASLFPGAQGLQAALDSSRHCAAIRAIQSEVTGDHVERMTMTSWSILQSRRLILMITGADKWAVYQRACESGASPELPISLFIHQQKLPLEVYWAP